MLDSLLKLEPYQDAYQRRRAQGLYIAAFVWVAILANILLERAVTDAAVTNVQLAIWLATGSAFWLNATGRMVPAGWVFTLGTITAFFIPGIASQHPFDGLDIILLGLIIVSTGLFLVDREVVMATLYAGGLWLLVFLVEGNVQPLMPDASLTLIQIMLVGLTGISGIVAWFSAGNIAQSTESHRNKQLHTAMSQTSAAIMQHILTHTSLETLLNEAVGLIRDGLEDVNQAQVFLLEGDGKAARLRASSGDAGRALVANRYQENVKDQNMVGRVIQSNQFVRANPGHSPSSAPPENLFPDTAARLALPLRSQTGISGVLDLHSLKANAFPEEEAALLQALADQVAIAVDNARLLEEAQDQARHAEALVQASHIIGHTTGDFEKGIGHLIKTVSETGEYSRWWVGLLEPDKKGLKRIAAFSPPDSGLLLPDIINLSEEKNTFSETINSKNPVLVNRFDDHPVLGNVSSAIHEVFGKHLAMPIFDSSGSTVEGVLLVGRELDAHDLNEGDLQLMGALSNQIAIVIENHRLFDQVKEDQKTLQSVIDAMPTGVVVIDKAHTVILVNEQAQHLLGAEIQAGASLDSAYSLYRTGSENPYPVSELPVWLALEKAKAFSAEDLTVRHPDGTGKDMISRAAPILDTRGEVIAVVSVYQDISDLRQLERALQESLNETTRLYEGTRALARASEFSSITDAVIQQVATLGPDHIIVALQQDKPTDEVATEIVRTWTKEGVGDSSVPALPEAILVPEVTQDTRSLAITAKDLHMVPGITEDQISALQANGVVTVAILPMQVRDRVFGAVVALFSLEHSFNPQERRFLGALADQASIAFDAALGVERIQEALQSTAGLYQASRSIAEAQDTDEALAIIGEEIRAMEPDRIDVFLARSQEEFEDPAQVLMWMKDEAQDTFPALPPDGDFDMLDSAEFFLEDVHEAQEHPLGAVMIEQGSPYRAIATVAFRTGGQVIGRLAAAFRAPRPIGERERQFLRMLADSTAYQIENDLLFQQTQDSLEETGILYQAIRAFANVEGPEGVIQAIIDYAADPGVDIAHLLVLNGESWDAPGAMVEVAYSWVREEATNLEKQRLTPERFAGWEQLARHEVQWVDDTATDTLISEEARSSYIAFGIASFALIPLTVSGNPIGAILLGSSIPRKHSEREIRIYQSLADQAAITLENKQLYEQSESRARQLAISAQVGQAANSILKLDELFPEVVDYIKNAFQYDHVQIFMVSPDRSDALLRASTGKAGRKLLSINHSLPVGSHSVIGAVTEQGIPLIALDTEDAEVVHKPNPHLPDTRSEMAVPLIAKGDIVGALDVQSNVPNAFSEDDIQILSALADQISVAIENARLFELSEQTLDETQVLYQTMRALANVEDTQGILETVVAFALSPELDIAHLFVLNGDTWNSPGASADVITSWVAGDAADLTGKRFTPDDFDGWEQLAVDEILWVDDVDADELVTQPQRESFKSLGIKAFSIIPLAVAGKPNGAILLGCSLPHTHAEREIRIYQSLADQAAITLENKQLFEQSEARARQLAISAQVGQAANSILNLDELFPEVVVYIKDAFRYDHVQIFMISADRKNAVLRASTGKAGQKLLGINHSLPVGSRSVIGAVTEQGIPLIALDTEDAQVVHKPNPFLPDTRSEMAVPLIAKGQIVGALDVQSNQPTAFNQDDIQILSALADQLAVAIENARLFELSQQRSEEMSFLFNVTAEATSVGELPDILQRVSMMLREEFKATLVVLYLVEAEDQILDPVAVASENGTIAKDSLSPIALDARDNVAGMLRTFIPAILKDVNMAKDYVPRLQSVKSGVYMPLGTRDNSVGVLVAESELPGHFDENVLELLQTLAGSLSAVIQTAKLLFDVQQANEKLREIDQLKTNFLAAMSHELRTPLNSIIGFSRVILKGIDGPVTDMQKQDLQTIHDSGKHLLGLVNDILDQAKIEAGKMELAREYFDLTAVIKGVMDSAKGLTKEKPIRLHVEVPEDFPKAFGDEFRTRQVLFNLISNAAKFTSDGSITTTAHQVEIDDHPFVQVSVTDTGIGIKEEDFPKLFESFQQVDNSLTRAAEGTGLGLPLARSLVELQGGLMTVESEYGIGSTFNITIPLEPLPEPEADIDPEQSGDEATAETPAPPKLVMVVEEDVDMINLYRRYLSKEGYDVIGITQLDDVQKTIGMYQLAAAILDVNFADGKGWEVLETLATQLPVVVSSLDDNRDRSTQLQAVYHLVKPFVQEDLAKAMEQVPSSDV